MGKNRKVIVLFGVLIFCLIGYSFKTFVGNNRIKSGKKLTFFITSDIHYLARDLTDNGQAFKIFVGQGDGKQLGYIWQILDAFTSEIQRKKPDILIISGDLTNNGERKSHLELAGKLEKIKKMGTLVYVVPGNHDVLNPYARGFKGEDQYRVDYVSDKDFSKIYGNFGYNVAISRDKSTLSYLAAPSQDIWLLMLDTAQYRNNIKNDEPQIDGRISEETYKWIEKCSELAKKKGVHIITVMHHSLIDHSNVMSRNFTINNKEEAIKRFQEYGLNLVFSGHIHFQNISSYKENGSLTYDIASSALSVYPQQYGILEYSPDSGYNYHTSQVDVDSWSKEKGIVDKNLNNFKVYSRNAFYERGYYTAYLDLIGMDGFTEEQKKLMSRTMGELNLKHFDGTQNVGMDKIRNSPGFRLWEKAPASFARNLVMNLAYDGSRDNNNLQIPKYDK